MGPFYNGAASRPGFTGHACGVRVQKVQKVQRVQRVQRVMVSPLDMPFGHEGSEGAPKGRKGARLAPQVV